MNPSRAVGPWAWTSQRPIRVLELRSACGNGGGPEKTILLGAAGANPDRTKVTVCYLRDLRDTSYRIDTRARQLGVDYVEIPERHSFDPAVWPALRRLVRERRIDIVHAHEYKTDALALLLARAEGVRPMATVHGWITNTPRERVYRFVDQRLLARYPLVVAVSDVIRQTLIENGASPRRVRRLLNGVDHRYFRRRHTKLSARARLGLSVEGLAIGSIGRLGREKRFDLLIAAAARLQPAPTVVLAGDGAAKQQLETLAADLAVPLRLLGHCGDVRDVYDALDIFVQSSDTEGVPNAVLEAMAMEVPVVATDVGGTGEIVSHERQGLLTPRGDVDALVAAIRETAQNLPAAARRVAAARTRVEQELAFDARMQALERLYRELMAEPTSPSARTLSAAADFLT